MPGVYIYIYVCIYAHVICIHTIKEGSVAAVEISTKFRTENRGVDEAWDALEQMHVEGKTTDKWTAATAVGHIGALVISRCDFFGADKVNGHNHSDKYIKHIEKREYIYKWMYNTSYNNTKWIIISDNNDDNIYIQYGI